MIGLLGLIGWKVTVMLEELIEAGIQLPETNIHAVSLGGDQFTDAYTTINPNQKIPTIVHDGRPIIESCAILQYLGETFESSLYPTDERRWDDFFCQIWDRATNATEIMRNWIDRACQGFTSRFRLVSGMVGAAERRSEL